MTPIDENPTKLDKLGIWVSSLCALHCLALPVLVPLLPLIGSSFFAQVWFERTILTFSLIVGAVALVSGAIRYHGKYYPLAYELYMSQGQDLAATMQAILEISRKRLSEEEAVDYLQNIIN